MALDFSLLQAGTTYSRKDLASAWNYKSFHALARGVVTPAGDNKIVLFVTNEKQEAAEQYKNSLDGSVLNWQGPTDHFAEQRMLNAKPNGEEIHAFYRERHHSDFTYLGQVEIAKSALHPSEPSSFTFRVKSV